MTTDAMNKTDIQAPAELLPGWYVALSQLPGLPVKLRLAVLAGVTATVQQMPVFSCRNHRWSGAPRAPAKASESGEGSAHLAGEYPDLADPEDASIEAEKMESAFLADCMNSSRLTGETRT